MKFLELRDSTSRFRFGQSCLGFIGCLCVCYAVWTPSWLNDKGLWSEWNVSQSDLSNNVEDFVFSVVEAERVMGVISFMMALATGALCLVIAFWWSSDTMLSYSNARSLLMAGQALYPTTLLLLTMTSTGFFFLLSWSVFTHHHLEEIYEDFTSLGSSYWLGALGWALLLVVEVIVFIFEQAVAPNVLPDLESGVKPRKIAANRKEAKRCHSAGYQPAVYKSNMAPKRHTSIL